MISKITKLNKWWKLLVIVITALSFALLKSIDVFSSYSAYGFWLTFGIIVAMGIFYWLIFELLVGFWFSGIKDKLNGEIDYAGFMNLCRVFVILLNILLFFIFKLIIKINFFANYLLLFINLIFIFIYFLILWIILKKYIFSTETAKNKKLEFYFFGFGFMYLFLHTIMWGVL